MRSAGRTATALGLVAIGLMLPSSASAATVTIGQVAPAGTADFCSGCTYIQTQVDVTSPSYTVPPGNWTVTSWSMMSGTTASGDDRLRIWRPEVTGLGTVYRLVQQSNEEAVTATPGGAERSFTTSLPVQGGDLLGLRTGTTSGDAIGPYPTTQVNDSPWNVVGDPMPGQTVGPGGDITLHGAFPMLLLNVSATLLQDPPVSQPNPPGPPGSTPKKCKKKKAKHSAASAKKKCKKKRKKK